MYNNIKIIFHIQIIHVFQEIHSRKCFMYIAYYILYCTLISISCTLIQIMKNNHLNTECFVQVKYYLKIYIFCENNKCTNNKFI